MKNIAKPLRNIIPAKLKIFNNIESPRGHRLEWCQGAESAAQRELCGSVCCSQCPEFDLGRYRCPPAGTGQERFSSNGQRPRPCAGGDRRQIPNESTRRKTTGSEATPKTIRWYTRSQKMRRIRRSGRSRAAHRTAASVTRFSLTPACQYYS